MNSRSVSVLCMLAFCCFANAWAGSLSLTLDQRVRYQKALEQVFWQHRIWPKDNARPKPPLETILSDANIRSRTEDDLRKSYALDAYWKKRIDAKDLQAEMDRMANETRNPTMLRELWAVLDNDPYVIAECLARPLLADRLAQQIDGFNRWWSENQEKLPVSFQLSVFNYKLPQMNSGVSFRDLGIQAITPGSPSGRVEHVAVWTGTEMIAWGGVDFCVLDFCPPTDTGGLYNAATNSWRSTSILGAPCCLDTPTAVWTGTEMIVWGRANVVKGARYNPTTNLWRSITATNAPSERFGHSAVWTGKEMIIWGGSGPSRQLNTGARYSPASDSWKPISTKNAPVAQTFPRLVWTGKEVIIWGGGDNNVINTGRRYNPATNQWTSITLTNAPEARGRYVAVFSGSKLIVWGGTNGKGVHLTTGGRYNPATDRWIPTSITNAPETPGSYSAVSTGSGLIVWNATRRTGGIYSHKTDQWASVPITNSPGSRQGHSAVWTGIELIIWGGSKGDFPPSFLQNGGRYNPTRNKWTKF